MLRIGADFEEYRAHYTLSKRDYYGLLRIEHDSTTDEIKAAFNQLAQVVKPDIDKGDTRAQEYMKESGGQISEETRLEELRTWSYQEGERQRGKQRAERRARDQAGLEASEEDWKGADADSGEHHRRQKADAESAKQRQQTEEERAQAVRAEKERRAEDVRSRRRQIDDFVKEKLAVEARKVQAEAELRVLLEERNKPKEAHEARLEQRKAVDEKKRKRK